VCHAGELGGKEEDTRFQVHTVPFGYYLHDDNLHYVVAERSEKMSALL
jgi:hypothetical protein